ncbi:MAG: aromatic ring-hydroxylating dioxygenase subunit alpha [Proteobacteria bacterium]|nr:aromatic ring-hydroxylating dioxygenase subunit alpha [Pseudomonadota bacterium]
MFLKNAWYVAAWEHEVAHQLLAVQIIGQRLVLYRTDAGAPVALEDACAHRKLPLSMGTLQGDHIQCGYHGLEYNMTGRCIRIPGASKIPQKVRVRSYPAVSRYGLVWVWMGDVAAADESQIPLVEHCDDPQWGRNRGGSMIVDCNYLYVTDNLLDPSHVTWVHRSSFGNADCEGEPVEVTESPQGVRAARWVYGGEVAPFYRFLVPFSGPCDRLQQYEVRYPAHAIIKALFTPAGTGGHGKPLDERALVMDSYNFLTPISENQTRYFWFQMRNRRADDEEISKAMDEGVRKAFDEDRVVLAAVHRGLQHAVSQPIDLAIDRAPLTFRRNLGRLIDEEAGAGARASA